MITMLLAIALLGGPPVLTPGERVQVPDRFYRRLLSVDELPKSYGTLDWGESRFGTWLEASSARGPDAFETIKRRLGPPLMLPDWSSRRGRVGYVFALHETDEAGLLILLESRTQTVELKLYRSFLKPQKPPAAPPATSGSPC